MTLEELKKILMELDDIRAEADKRLEELSKRFAELKARDEEPPKPPHLRPYLEDDQNYFFINAMGKIEKSKWMSDRFDLGAREIGNIFMGETAAEFYAERLTVLAEMQEWAGSWDDQYTICVDPCDGTNLYVFDRLLWTSGEMRFAKKEDAEGCIKAVGVDRIKKYYFMIPDDTDNDES